MWSLSKRDTEPDPEMTQMLELPDKDFKITLISILKEIVDDMWKRWERDGNYKKKEPVEMLDMKIR